VIVHGENKLIFNEMMMRSALLQLLVGIVLLYCVSSLKQQSAGRHVAPLGHIINIYNWEYFLCRVNHICGVMVSMLA
jgi:hypothetical protein